MRGSMKETRRRSIRANRSVREIEGIVVEMNEGRLLRSEGRGWEAAGVDVAKRALLKERRDDNGGDSTAGRIFAANLSSGGIFL